VNSYGRIIVFPSGEVPYMGSSLLRFTTRLLYTVLLTSQIHISASWILNSLAE
jgi:hypothetical protein